MPIDSTELILECAHNNTPLPSGDLYFRPPLLLEDLGLIGSHGTILRPIHNYSGALLKVSSKNGDITTGLPVRKHYRNFRVAGHNNIGYGIQLSGTDASGNTIPAACMVFDNVEVINCYFGLAIGGAVDVKFRDSLFSRNTHNIYLPGSFGWCITTLTFTGCNIREALGMGVYIQAGAGVTFNGWTIIESNKGAGMVIQPSQANSLITKNISLDDVWFENNAGGNLSDPFGLVRKGNVIMDGNAW